MVKLNAMSDFFSFPEKEQLCHKHAGTVKADFSETESASGQMESTCSGTLILLGKDIQ